MHEILTLQLGQRSNYLATHFWNVQESYFTYSENEISAVDHDIHFRPGIGADGSETYTPRTLIYDLKGGFGTLRRLNALYEAVNEEAAADALWNGKTVIQKQPKIAQNEYQRSLDQGLPTPQLTASTVRYWSDFNRVYYHPRSIVQLSEYELNSQLEPFRNWETGAELFRDLDKENDLLDRDVRLFAEECDQLSAFQIFTGSDDAWGGFAARYIDRLRDEFGKTSIWTFGIEDGKTVGRDKKLLRLLNTAYSIDEISTQASAYIPIAEPPRQLPSYINGTLDSQWYSSALLMTAIETLTLPSRSRQSIQKSARLSDLESILNVNGSQKLMKLAMNVRFIDGEVPASKNNVSAESEMKAEDASPKKETFDVDFAPSSVDGNEKSKKNHIFGRVTVTRGSSHRGEAEPTEVQERRRRRFMSEPILERFSSRLVFPTVDSFPPDLFPDQSLPEAEITSAITTSTDMSSRLTSLQKIIGRVAPIDRREALYNSLGEIAEDYLEGYDSGSDSDDDI